MKPGIIATLAAVAAIGGVAYLGSRLNDEDTSPIPPIEYQEPVTCSCSHKEPAVLSPTTKPVETRPIEASPLEKKVIPEGPSVPSFERVMQEYVPASWVVDKSSFYRTAVEQLIGGTGVKGIVTLFEDLPRDKLVKDEEGWRIWKSPDGADYRYQRFNGRHYMEVAGKDGFRLRYQTMSNGADLIDGLIGERWGVKDGRPEAWQYTIRPGQIKDSGMITIGASTYEGVQIFGTPLWRDHNPSNEYDNPATSSDALWILRNRRLDTTFKGLNE